MTAPAERWRLAHPELRRALDPERLAILDVLADRGPLPLGVATHEAGVGPGLARWHATVLRRHGLADVDTSIGGLNLSAPCAITPAGRALVAALAVLADNRRQPDRRPPTTADTPPPGAVLCACVACVEDRAASAGAGRAPDPDRSGGRRDRAPL
jgi:hypothetical protein